MMINVGGNIAISQAIAARFEQARASMQTNLDRATAANTPGVQFVLQNTVDVNGSTLTVGQYVVLPASTGAQATTPILGGGGGALTSSEDINARSSAN